MIEPVLVDTGPLVAMISRQDQHHRACTAEARRIQGPAYTTWPVVTEAAWLLRDIPDSLKRLLALVDGTDIECLDLGADAPDWISARGERYQGLSPQIADLSLLYVAYRHEIRQIFTLDRRDFLVFRDAKGQPFHLLPESL